MMTSRSVALPLVVVLSMFAVPQPTYGQGFIVGRDVRHTVHRTFDIREVRIDAEVRDQVANVQVSQVFHNPGSDTVDAEYLFPLPDEGAIQGFVLLVDGKELPGRLLPKEEARRIYEDIVRSKRDPALLEYMGQGLYRTSVFPIPPGADRKVTMRYTQVCKRERDVVEFLYPLGSQKFTSKPIQKLELNLRIESKDPIKSLYAPVYDAVVSRTGDHEAKVTVQLRDVVPTKDFRLIATLGNGSVGATVLSYRPSESEDGYFLLLASPEVRAQETKPAPKTVVFVLDRSGSMAGKKIDQAKKALQFVLNNLQNDDLFNIVVYDDRVETYKPELQRFDSTSRVEAERFVANIREGGSTNISEALKTALGQIKDETRPSYVLFITDGLPTAGETNELKLAAATKQSNKNRSRLFVFGVGYDVNARLLDRLSGGNSGTSEYVKPDDDIESHVAAFYRKLTRPALSSIAVELAGVDVNRTYPRDVPDLFEGGQLVLTGRYRQSGKTTLRLKGKVGGQIQTLEVPVELAKAGEGTRHDFVEKLWAIRRVGFIIDQIDLNGQNKELTDELIALSTRFGILTPYTSFLADERVNLHASVSNRQITTDNLRRLAEVQGGYGVAQRGAKQLYLQSDKADSSVASAYGMAAEAAAAPNSQVAARINRPAQPGLPGGGHPSPATAGLAAGGPGAPPVPRYTVPAIGSTEARRSEPTSLRQMGNKTFFRKDNRWIDSVVKADEEKKAQVVEQYSEEFFRIARSLQPEMSQYLVFDEGVTVDLGGKVYRFDPPKSKR